MIEDEYYFIPDAETVFRLVKRTDPPGHKSTDGFINVIDVETKKSERVKEANSHPAGSLNELENPPDDLIKLQYIHSPTILHTLRTRYHKDLIYTSIGPILVAFNPFKWIEGIYDEDRKEKYKTNQFNLSDQPHVFAVAHDAYTDLSFGRDQSLIIR